MKNRILKNILLLLVLSVVISCSKSDLEPTLTTSKSIDESVGTLNDLKAIANGMYDRMSHYYYYGRDYVVYGDVRSNNAFSNASSGRFDEVDMMLLLPTHAYPTDTWQQMYKVVASANVIIGASTDDIADYNLKKDEVDDIIGQAYAIRALAHFDLMKLYGQKHTGGNLGVPYVLVYKGEETAPARNTISEVNAYIEADLKEAKLLIGSGSYNYFSLDAVYALEARFFLYTEQWEKARDAAAKVIERANFKILSATDYVSSFGIDQSANSIFELEYSGTDKLGNTSLGEIYNGSAYGDIEACENLYNLFEEGDVRIGDDIFAKNANGEYRNIGKFPTDQGDHNLSLFRYEEVILNYAEALFRINSSDANALIYLNMIPENRDATSYAEVNENNILIERRKELCFEGFAFDDLMRTGQGLPYVEEKKDYLPIGVSYGDSRLAFPIPAHEMNANSNMEQNDKY